MSEIITYSYNPAIVPGMDKDEAGKKSYGWQLATCEWDKAAITEMVRTRAYMASELKDGHKIKASVKAIHNIILDFDSGHPSLEDFLTLTKNYRFRYILHTTVNHQKPKLNSDKKPIPGSEKDKFRVIIPLKEPISETALEASSVFWTSNKRFPTLDPSSFQGSRYYMVNPDAIVKLHESYINNTGETEECSFLDPFAAEMIPKSFRKNLKGRPKTLATVDESKLDGSFSIDEVVRLHDGQEIKYRDITEKTKVFCPFCDQSKRQHPDKDNAFVDFNKAGQLFLSCSSEHKTYWCHSSEIVSEKSSLFFNETLGYASRILDEENGGGYVVFKNDADWLNFCHHNSVNPACKIFLPRVSIIFDPAKISCLQDGYFNMFQESEYLKLHDTTQPLLSGDEILKLMEQQTPVINEIMLNIFGDQDYLKRFMNWNAVILNKRIKVDTSWLITSKEQGIGKGLMFDRILQPIYGKRQSMLVPGERMAKNFNAQDQTVWLKVFDEVYAPGNYKENLARKEWLKYIITAREQTIELKGIDAFQMANHMNLILYSNNECPIFLDSKDRRFSVIRNENAKKTDQLSFYKNIPDMQERIDAELETFAGIILRYNCDVESANKAIDSSAKDKLKETTADDFEEFAKALLEKDDSYFLLCEIFPPSANDKMFNSGIQLSSEGQEVEYAIKEGFIPSKSMNKICKFHFSGQHYKNITGRLKLKGIERITKKVDGVPTSVYTVR
ncbi:MAG: DUF5906 domain-containing protein [Ignavibacteriaceae bacterium]|nr:DUF5906 domain-containing protein [Ignavibacteriaceae bacterium]